MAHWFTSDLHFGHVNILKYCNRPFANIEEHDAALVNNWNAKVKPEDIVFILGDFSMNRYAACKFAPLLNGTKYLIPGNHDVVHPRFGNKAEIAKEAYNAAGLNVCNINAILVAGYHDLRMNHFPAGKHYAKFEKWLPPEHVEGQWHLHGHTHQTTRIEGHNVHLGVDAWSYSPVSLEDIVELIEQQSK